MACEADLLTRDRDLEGPGSEAEQRRLPGAVRPGDQQESSLFELEVEPFEDALLAVALAESFRADQRFVAHETIASAMTKPQKTRLITPFMVKKAMSSLRKSPGRTSECS